jgi:hypothetical protein
MKTYIKALGIVGTIFVVSNTAFADGGRVCTQSTNNVKGAVNTTYGEYYVNDIQGNVRSLTGSVCYSNPAAGGANECLPVLGTLTVVNGRVEIATKGSEQVPGVAGTDGFSTSTAHVDLDGSTLTGTGTALVATIGPNKQPVWTVGEGTVKVTSCVSSLNRADNVAARSLIAKMIKQSN